jgi:hypothetical protein
MPHSQVSSSASDLLTDSTRASSVNAFHRPLRLSSPALNFAERNSDHLSPAVEGFSFTDPETKLHPPITPSDGTSFEVDFDEKPHAVQLETSDTKTPSMSQPVARSDSNKRRTQHYEDSLAYKEGHGQSTKERIQKESPVIAELRTNVIVSSPPSHYDPLALTPPRSKTSLPSLQIYHNTSRSDTVDRNPPL